MDREHHIDRLEADGDESGRGALRVDSMAADHMLAGDPRRPSVGGHRHGSRRPGKTEFPDISDDAAIEAVNAANAAAHERIKKGRAIRTGYASGMVIEVVIQEGRIEAAYPLRGDGVVFNDPIMRRQVPRPLLDTDQRE
ncbi:MAG: EndoU domain-containing protein [Bifidobacteriaceae bacterium]|nr:EndoU domain-containing protein [Bifidobacteriaceae bacterium]